MFRPSRAWRSWQAGQHLTSRGIPTPRNLAFLARRRNAWYNPFSWFLPHETYLVTDKQDNTITLAEYVRRVVPTLDPAEARARVRSLNLALARLIRSLHERSLSHRDLKASNILVHLDRLESDEFLSLIDLVGVRLQNPVPRGRRIKNLARLSVSLVEDPGPHVRRDPAVPPGLPPLGTLPTLRLEGRLAIHREGHPGETERGTGAGDDPFPDPEAMGAQA